MSWTSPEDIKDELQRRWEKGQVLGARVRAENLYPLKLAIKRPTSADLSSRFEDARRWIRALEGGSRAARGFGYELTWTEVNYRELGRNRVPSAAVVPSEEDHLRLIGKQRDCERFRTICESTLQEFPLLEEWLGRRPLTVLEHAEEWQRILAVMRWFRGHPSPGLYLRQLEIENVDSKFIERHRGLLTQLLDVVLAPGGATAPGGTGVRGFEQRFGLLSKPMLVRFRVVDDALRVGGLSDLTVTASEFAALRPRVTQVFVTENEVNGLAFPRVANSIVVFGLGYGLDVLFQVPWLAHVHIHYWGDIDTHGFAMLDRLRAVYPGARSLLMDRGTLLGHRHLWVREGKPHRGSLTRLNTPEQALFRDLQENLLGEQVRLEQERISYTHLKQALASLPGA